MATDRFLIGPIETGLQTDKRPWLTQEDAFQRLQNAYVYRGRLRKRFGSVLLNQTIAQEYQQLYSRLRINIGTTDPVTGSLPATNIGTLATQIKVGQMFSVGDVMFTVTALGAVATLTTDATITGAIDTTVTPNTFAITGNSTTNLNTAVYYYPANPVMGLLIYENAAINDEQLIGFDTQFAYIRSGGAWTRLGTAAWTGSNSQFYSATTWRGANNYDRLFFVVNYNQPDQIKYYNGTVWAVINPQTHSALAGATLESARVALVFKNRLLLFNTIEHLNGDPAGTYRTFVNRVRYSQNGSPVAANAWYENVPGRGDAIDAPTSEAIISARIIKGRVVVYFERSTWQLTYTGNEQLPFSWIKISDELGCESQNSTVVFDDSIVGVGNVGIHACNGVYVKRIDQKIPDDVFNIHNENDGVERVYGIKDYYNELVYWTFPSAEDDPTYPNRVLIFNYRNGSWAYNDDTITCFGYFQLTNDITWESVSSTWEEIGTTWGEGTTQGKFRNIIAGNQEGFTFLIRTKTQRNSPALQITNITTPSNVRLAVVSHNFIVGEFIYIENCQGSIVLNRNSYQIVAVGTDYIEIVEPDYAGVYTGGGTIARVSKIDILTKQFNFYTGSNRNMNLKSINFFLDRTSSGEIYVDYAPSTSSLFVETFDLETFALTDIELYQDQLWHPVYPMANGAFVQLRLYLSNEQLLDPGIIFNDFQLNAMLFEVQPTSARIQ